MKELLLLIALILSLIFDSPDQCKNSTGITSSLIKYTYYAIEGGLQYIHYNTIHYCTAVNKNAQSWQLKVGPNTYAISFPYLLCPQSYLILWQLEWLQLYIK